MLCRYKTFETKVLNLVKYGAIINEIIFLFLKNFFRIFKHLAQSKKKKTSEIYLLHFNHGFKLVLFIKFSVEKLSYK